MSELKFLEWKIQKGKTQGLLEENRGEIFKIFIYIQEHLYFLELAERELIKGLKSS